MKVKSLQSIESTKYRGGWYFWRAHSKAAYEHRSTEHSVVPKESGRPVCHHSSLVHLLGTNGLSLGPCQSNMTISSPCVYKVCVPEGSGESPNTKTQTLLLANAIFSKINKNSGHEPYTESTKHRLEVNWIRAIFDIWSYRVIPHALIFP